MATLDARLAGPRRASGLAVRQSQSLGLCCDTAPFHAISPYHRDYTRSPNLTEHMVQLPVYFVGASALRCQPAAATGMWHPLEVDTSS
jgi:hypothetical protein